MSVPAENIIVCTAVEVEVKATPFDLLLVDETKREGDWEACPRVLNSIPDGIPYEGTYRYRVKYSLDDEGDLIVRIDYLVAGEEVYPAIYTLDGKHSAIVCFLPREWDGKRVTREVL